MTVTCYFVYYNEGPRQADQEDAGRGEEEEPGRGQAGQEGEEEGGGRGAGRGARGQGGWRHWRCREISTIFISLVKVPSSAFTNYQDESSPHGIFTLIQILQKLSQNFVDSSQFPVIMLLRRCGTSPSRATSGWTGRGPRSGTFRRAPTTLMSLSAPLV